MRLLHWVGLLVGAAVGLTVFGRQAPDPSRVVLLGNANSKESVELGHWYARVRGIPEQNLILLPMPESEGIVRSDFEKKILVPLQRRLQEEGWLDGIRRGDRIEALAHRVGHLVLLRGVPLRVEHADKALTWDEQIALAPNLFEAASVDSELALLPAGFWPTRFAVPNPVFRKAEPLAFDLNRILKVTRLDGPSNRAIQRVVEDGIAAERRGLTGRAYIDIGGPVPEGDSWLRECANIVDRLGFDLAVHDQPGLMPVDWRFDAAAIYFGWYAPAPRGAVAQPGLRFMPGAIAFHLHSFSGETVRSDKTAWLGPLVARGASITFGNVAEPRLQFSHYPHEILGRLAEGWCLGDAAAAGTPVFSWQGVVLGDPLYTPFKRPLSEQVGELSQLPPELAVWVAVRQSRLLVRQGKADEALVLLGEHEASHPALASTLALGELQVQLGERDKARETLVKLAGLRDFTAVSWPAGVRAARLMESVEAWESAARLHEALAGQGSIDPKVRAGILESALPVADKLGQPRLRDRWLKQVLELRPPPKPVSQ